MFFCHAFQVGGAFRLATCMIPVKKEKEGEIRTEPNTCMPSFPHHHQRSRLFIACRPRPRMCQAKKILTAISISITILFDYSVVPLLKWWNIIFKIIYLIQHENNFFSRKHCATKKIIGMIKLK
jgi:hypothetical protein